MLACGRRGKIQSKGSGTSLDQFLDSLGAFRGWTDGGHDLGSTVLIELAHTEAQKPCGNYHPGVIRPFQWELNAYQDAARADSYPR